MTFIAFDDATGAPLVAWQDGRLVGRRDRVRALLRLSRALNGRFFGIQPLGPGAIRNHIKDPFAAYDFIRWFFSDRGVQVRMEGDIPTPSFPEGSIQ